MRPRGCECAMKLNLPRNQCLRFEIRVGFDITEHEEELFLSIINQTEHHDHRATEYGLSNSTVGIFGSRFVVEGSILRSVANLGLERREDQPWASVWLLNDLPDEPLPRPPRNIRPVSLLMQTAGSSFKPASAECTAVFQYNQLEGWVSKLVLPAPMIAQVEPHGITHIEMAEFSNRTDEGVNYRIFVRNDEESRAVRHTVQYEQSLDWSRRSLRRLLDYGREISGRLIAREGQN